MEREMFTKEQAIAFDNNKIWEQMNDKDIAELQLFNEFLCVPYPVFHKAIQTALGRPVYIHEMVFISELRKEFLGERPTPTFQDIINLIPENKRVIVLHA